MAKYVHYLPKRTYYLRMRYTENWDWEPDEQEHPTAEAAWEAFRLFAEARSSEIYSSIELYEYDWEAREEHTMATLTFTPRS